MEQISATVDDAVIMFSTFWLHVTVPAIGGDVTVMLPACVIVSATGDDVTIMLPACVTIPIIGGDVTKILPAFWLCITIPAFDEDVTIVFSALLLCIIIAATLSDGTVIMPVSINEGSSSTSEHEDLWLIATCLGRLKCKFSKMR